MLESLLDEASIVPSFEYCKNHTSSVWCLSSRTGVAGKSSRSHLWSRYSEGEAAVLWYRQFEIQLSLTWSNSTDNRCSGIMTLGDIDSVMR
jgi:hypothetical protein